MRDDEGIRTGMKIGRIEIGKAVTIRSWSFQKKS